MYIKACKDPMQQWTKIPFIAIDDAIFYVLESWPPRWCALDLVELDRIAAQKQKEEAKLRVMKLAEKRQDEKVVIEIKVIREATKATAE